LDFTHKSKYTAKFNTKHFSSKYKNSVKKYDNFYFKNLYEYGATCSSITPKEKMETLQKRMDKFFSDNKTSSGQKIEVLQNWRHSLKTEQDAYDFGFQAMEEIQTKRLQSIVNPKEKQYEQILSQIKDRYSYSSKQTKEAYLFSEKINLIENMMKEEIAKVRQEHATSLKISRKD
jgi:hypothetical protein